MKQVGINEAKDLIKEIFDNGNTRLVPLLVGGAGIGKTQAVEQVCAELGLEMAYVNLADRQPGEFAVNFVTSEDELGTAIDPVFAADVVFFDELNRAELVMSEVMNIMQSRTIRGAELGCKFVCAMNLGGSYAVSDLDPAQWGRFMRIDMCADMTDWARYMSEKHAGNERLASLLSFVRKNGLLTTEDDMVTPRTWDELMVLGVDRFAGHLLPSEVSDDLALWFRQERYPSYAEAVLPDGPWVDVYAEYDYVLGALNEPVETIAALLKRVTADSLGIVLKEIGERDPKLHLKIMSDPGFAEYVESI